MHTIHFGDGRIDDLVHHDATSAGTVTDIPATRAAAIAENAGASQLEALAHSVLRIVGDHPGMLGRLRVARVASGRSLPGIDEVQGARLARYGVAADLPLREVVDLVDAMLDGGLVHRTSGPRPVLALTRAGHHALDALEGSSA